MSERTGLGIVEIAVLEALESGHYLKCSRALARLEERIGLAADYAYDVLVDLARPWTMPVNLVQGQGNFGSRGNDPAANFRYTEARITRAGRVALAAERGELAAVPIGLINGNTYGAGLRPPFRPRAVIDTVREVIERPRMPDKELTAAVGMPCFPAGCIVTGSLATLAAGRRTQLRLEARVSIGDDGSTVVIESIPPNISTDDVVQIIASRARARPWAHDHPGLHRITQLPLADVTDETSERTDPSGRIICTPRRGTSPEQLREMLLAIPGVYTTMPVALPRPLPALIRRLVQGDADQDLLASLAALEEAVRDQGRW
jgi:DNA gyrase/topoisomerase IV subunit A